MTFGVGCHTMLIANILFKTSLFQRLGKKNNQSWVSDADREIPTLGSTDNAGNSVKPCFRHHLFTLGLGFLCLHRRPMIDSICHSCLLKQSQQQSKHGNGNHYPLISLNQYKGRVPVRKGGNQYREGNIVCRQV